MAAGEVIVIPCLSDNYTYLVRCHRSEMTAIIDPGEAAPVIKELQAVSYTHLTLPTTPYV